MCTGQITPLSKNLGYPEILRRYENGYIEILQQSDQYYTLSIDVYGNGTVISDPSGINCPTDCNEDYLEGTLVKLTAVNDNGWHFSEQGGDYCEVNVQ